MTRGFVLLLPGLVITAVWLLVSFGEPTAPRDVPEENPTTPVVSVPDTVAQEVTPRTTERQLAYAFSSRIGFRTLGQPAPGEWLYHHDEPGQTYDEYVRSRPVTARAGANVLAFLPVGEFRKEEKEVSDATFRFAGLWFGLPVRVLGSAGLPKEDFQRKRNFGYGNDPVRQFRTDWFLNRLLPPRLPKDAVMLAAVTTADLYPDDNWNYVFGIASLRRRIGVYSICRYFPGFWGRPATPESRIVALRRAIKLVTHELGHCFGVLHCTAFECNMSGSNSLGESDRRPVFLCPVCLRKLQWNLGFDVLDRYERLAAFYVAEGLAFEADWTKGRIARISAVR